MGSDGVDGKGVDGFDGFDGGTSDVEVLWCPSCGERTHRSSLFDSRLPVVLVAPVRTEIVVRVCPMAVLWHSDVIPFRVHEVGKEREELEEKSKEISVGDVGQTRRALPDSARKRKVKVKEMGKKRVNETRSVLDRMMGGQAQLPSGGEAVGNNNSEGRAQSHSAFDTGSFPAPV